jgi:predicted lipoprotein with Yx(FWY)xxD motif
MAGTRRTLALIVGLATLGAVAPNAPAGSPRVTVAVGASAYGRVLFDGKGFSLYAFTHDPAGRSRCSGACAKPWPPYILSGTPRAGPGTRDSLIATTRRADGTRQVTYAGRPLYHYVGDRKPGQILCQNVLEFGGLWLVVRGNGAPVR